MSPDEEETAVRQLGELIGYGRTMQLCEQLWGKSLKRDGWPTGGQHSVGPCVAMLVPCPHTGYDGPVECDWCCGSGRVTKRVLEAMTTALVAKDRP